MLEIRKSLDPIVLISYSIGDMQWRKIIHKSLEDHGTSWNFKTIYFPKYRTTLLATPRHSYSVGMGELHIWIQDWIECSRSVTRMSQVSHNYNKKPIINKWWLFILPWNRRWILSCNFNGLGAEALIFNNFLTFPPTWSITLRNEG